MKLALRTRAAGRQLPPDVLRRIFLMYYSKFWHDKTNQLHFRSGFLSAGAPYAFDAKVKVHRRGLAEPEFMVTFETGLAGRVLCGWTPALSGSDIADVVDGLMGDGDRSRHHLMDLLLVAGGRIRGEYSYERPMRPKDETGPRMYLTKVLLEWLKMYGVPVCVLTTRQCALSLRVLGIGENLPVPHLFTK